MSSILEALKRVESAARPPEGAGPAAAFPARDPAPSRRPTRLFLVGGMLALLAAGAAFLLASRGPGEVRTLPGALRAKLPPEGQSPPAASPAPPEAPARRESEPPAPAPAGPGSQETKPPAARPPAADPRRPGPPAVQAPPPSARLRAPAEAPPAPRPPATPPARPEAARAPQGEGLPRLEDGRLKLMAIAWFDDPGRRLAVVNGHIVREGESVEGFRVRAIRRDDIVVVTEDGRSLRLELNLKTVSD
ncbi:MAG: hypothetical protein WHT06_04815 [Desulfobacterales bacterium]